MQAVCILINSIFFKLSMTLMADNFSKNIKGIRTEIKVENIISPCREQREIQNKLCNVNDV